MKKIALVGLGFMGGMHTQAYRQLPNAKITAVAECDPERAKAAMTKLGLDVPLYPSLEKLLASESVDAVDICLPTDLHVEAALLAMEARKAVFCEKPMALSVKEAQLLVDKQEKVGTQLMIGHCIRFWPEYQAFKDFVESQVAGKLLSLTLQRRSARPMASSCNWMNDPKRSGGAALDLHIHDTDFVHQLLGQPKAVTSTGSLDKTGWSHILTHYAYDNISVTAEGGWNYPVKWGFQMAFQAIFERGAVEFDGAKNPTLVVTLEDQERKPLPFVAPNAGESTVGEGNLSSLGGYFNELHYFVERLEKNAPIEIATGRQSLNSLHTTLMEIVSATERRTVSL